MTAGFRGRVYAVVRQVPAGHVTTYGDVATVLGSPRVARHVGWALSALDPAGCASDGLPVPWHRVVNGRGRLSYRGDTDRGARQQQKLADEGVSLNDSGAIVDFKTLRYRYPDEVALALLAPETLSQP